MEEDGKDERYTVAAWPQRGLRINKSQLRELIPGGGNSLPQARNRIRE